MSESGLTYGSIGDQGRVFTLELSPQGKKVIAQLQKNLAPDALVKQIFALFDQAGGKIAALIIRKYLSGGEGLARRTGQLAKAVVGGARLNGQVPSIRVGIFRGPASKYANIQEHGGTVWPKNAKSLAMPVNDALTPAGVARWSSPRDYPRRLQFVPSRHGSSKVVGYLYDAIEIKAMKKNWAALRPLWILLSSADIPASHFLRNGMRDYLPQVAKDLLALLRKAFHAYQQA